MIKAGPKRVTFLSVMEDVRRVNNVRFNMFGAM